VSFKNLGLCEISKRLDVRTLSKKVVDASLGDRISLIHPPISNYILTVTAWKAASRVTAKGPHPTVQCGHAITKQRRHRDYLRGKDRDRKRNGLAGRGDRLLGQDGEPLLFGGAKKGNTGERHRSTRNREEQPQRPSKLLFL